ncbi:hypothetical protein P280DRAFT_18239 [Massarina eburnea CBS 473.64]|uniref:Uncharacterized protein n=1 Tax=Massarina eburnea CBS 473.64 TaxID=1395130 RepID=A0A6A6SIH1_9PLEO|nr:hypothetical protein P280DRAFT_18239 [Massarina eburnea CBS 473.64]
MHFSRLALTTILATASASAIPSSALTKRDEVTFEKSNNLKLTFSKDTVQLGTESIDDIFAKLDDACHTTGQCETNDISVKSQFLTKDSVSDISITLGPAGAYPTWIRNGLIDALKAAVKEIAKCSDVTHTDNCGFSATFCPGKTTTKNQCEVPAFWGINYQVASEANASPPWLSTDVKVEKKGAGAVCTDALKAMGGAAGVAAASPVGGAVAGIAGGIFSLLSFACT